MTVTPYDGPDAVWAQDQINNGLNQGNQGASPVGGKAIPASSPVPTVLVTWHTIPETEAMPPTGGGSGSSTTPPAPTSPDYTIDIPAVRSSESALLAAIQSAADKYNQLAGMFLPEQGSVYGQNATDGWWEDPGPYQQERYVTSADTIDSKAQQFANGTPASSDYTYVVQHGKLVQELQITNAVPGANTTQQYLLSQIANVMQLVGTYLDLVNAATTAYAQGDAYSTIPSVTKAQ